MKLTNNKLWVIIYSCVLKLQHKIKKNLIELDNEFRSIYLFISYILLIYEICKISLHTDVLQQRVTQSLTTNNNSIYYSYVIQKGIHPSSQSTQFILKRQFIDSLHCLPLKLSSHYSNSYSNSYPPPSIKVINLFTESTLHLNLPVNKFIAVPRNTFGEFKSKFTFIHFTKTSKKYKRYIARLAKQKYIKNHYIEYSCHTNLQFKQWICFSRMPVPEIQTVKIIVSTRGEFYVKYFYIPKYQVTPVFQFCTSSSPDHYFINFRKLNNVFVSKKDMRFANKYEALSFNSYLVFIHVGFFVLFSKILKNLYSEYGKEILIFFINVLKLIGIIKDDEWIKEELNLGTNKRDFRIIRNIHKKLYEVIGIDTIIPEISEIIWFLRFKKQHSNKWFKIGFPFRIAETQLLSNSFLLVGPPGTGKTVLAQAIAGESGVPILVQSGAILKHPRKLGKGAQTLQVLFERAQQLSPCIVFIDELDGIGSRRENISINTKSEYDLIELIETDLVYLLNAQAEELSSKKPALSSWDPLQERQEREQQEKEENFQIDQSRVPISVLQQNESENISRNEQLTVLTQLLIELDGLKSLTNVLVIGATNRKHILDPALLRPGRFDRILYVKLPNFQKRIDLFKLYVAKVGSQDSVMWSYLAKRTEGLSAAAISSIINESALIAINHNQKHNLHSLEQGIIRITTMPNRQIGQYLHKEMKHIQKQYGLFYQSIIPTQTVDKPLRITQLNQFKHQRNLNLYMHNAYYSTGKYFMSLMFNRTPSECFLCLLERKAHFVYSRKKNIIDLLNTQFTHRIQLESQLVFLHSGKAAQSLMNCLSLWAQQPIYSNNEKLIFHLFEETDRADIDLQKASIIIQYMVNKWYFYAEQVVTEKYHQIAFNVNKYEFDIEELKLLKAVSDEIGFQFPKQNRYINTHQKWMFRTWWQKNIQKHHNFAEFNYLQWYRLYLSDPEESEQNIEWVPADVYYHHIPEEGINPYFLWNEMLMSTRHYISMNIVFNTFNVAFRILRHNVELLDLIIDLLLRAGSLRDEQIQQKVKEFLIFGYRANQLTEYTSDEPLIVRKSWGKNSRCKTSKHIFLHKIEQSKQQFLEKQRLAQEQAEQAEELAQEQAEQAEELAQEQAEQAEELAQEQAEQAEELAQGQAEQAEELAQGQAEQAEEDPLLTDVSLDSNDKDNDIDQVNE